MVDRLFLAVPWGCLRFVIVVFPDHTHLLFLIPVWKKVHAPERFIHQSQRFSSLLMFILFLPFFISFKYDFHVDA